jgi:hypothetical protein
LEWLRGCEERESLCGGGRGIANREAIGEVDERFTLGGGGAG